MFNFFRPKASKLSEQQIEIAAAIHYIVKKKSNQALIDIELHDYDNDSIDSLCSLLEILGSDMFYIDTINMIKESLIKENREDVLIKILSKLSETLKHKLLYQHEIHKNEPCIKPSDLPM